MAHLTTTTAIQIADDYELCGDIRHAFLQSATLFTPIGPYDAYEVAARIADRAHRGSFEKPQHLLALGAAFLAVPLSEPEILEFLDTPERTVAELIDAIEKGPGAP